MALYLGQTFVCAQFLENQLIEFHQILYMHSCWQDLLGLQQFIFRFYPHFEKVGAILDFCCLSFSPSVPLSVCHNFISNQYLEKYFIESDEILYVHLY